jgi:hypothetical protein
MVERRLNHPLQGPDMDDIRERLNRIESGGTNQLVEQRVLNNSFETHKAQNERDFQHVDECIHRSDDDSKKRDSAVLEEVRTIKDDVAELKKFMWRASGALLVLVPLVNHLTSKFL